jgi:hypothetical protein
LVFLPDISPQPEYYPPKPRKPAYKKPLPSSYKPPNESEPPNEVNPFQPPSEVDPPTDEPLFYSSVKPTEQPAATETVPTEDLDLELKKRYPNLEEKMKKYIQAVISGSNYVTPASSPPIYFTEPPPELKQQNPEQEPELKQQNPEQEPEQEPGEDFDIPVESMEEAIFSSMSDIQSESDNSEPEMSADAPEQTEVEPTDTEANESDNTNPDSEIFPGYDDESQNISESESDLEQPGTDEDQERRRKSLFNKESDRTPTFRIPDHSSYKIKFPHFFRGFDDWNFYS